MHTYSCCLSIGLSDPSCWSRFLPLQTQPQPCAEAPLSSTVCMKRKETRHEGHLCQVRIHYGFCVQNGFTKLKHIRPAVNFFALFSTKVKQYIICGLSFCTTSPKINRSPSFFFNLNTLLIFSVMLKNTFFVLFLPEDKVLQRLEELNYFPPNPFTHAGSPFHWSSGMKFHRSSLRKKKKKKERKQKMGGKVKVGFSRLQATIKPVESEKKEGMKKDDGIGKGKEGGWVGGWVRGAGLLWRQ